MIRAATPADLSALSALFEALDAHHAALWPQIFQPLSAPARDHAALGALIADPDQAVLVTDDVVGMVHALKRTPSGFPGYRPASFLLVDTLHVDAAHRRRGHARALMDAAMTWGRDRGLARVEVGVWAGNDGAAALYADLGFTPLRTQLGRDL